MTERPAPVVAYSLSASVIRMGKGAKSLRRERKDRVRASKDRARRAAQARGDARKATK